MRDSKRKRLISSDEAVPATSQHATPCDDCPWRRDSLPGWLGGVGSLAWLKAANGGEKIDCHTLTGAQCAGAAVFRANCGRLERPGSENLVLPKDKETVFATPMEFKKHHDA